MALSVSEYSAFSGLPTLLKAIESAMISPPVHQFADWLK